MQLLYTGSYYNRFDPIITILKDTLPKTVTELCFGDTCIAEFCKESNIAWIGYDANPAFVNQAVNKGYKAVCTHLSADNPVQKADICIMVGSLYHFHHQIEEILRLMLHISNKIVISEPVVNLSDKKGLIGYLAKMFSNTGNKGYDFRYSKQTLTEVLQSMGQKLSFTYTDVGMFKKDWIVLIEKK